MKTVKTAELKARLSQYLQMVRKGEVITVLDRETPIASIQPVNQVGRLMIVRPARPGRRLSDVKLPPAPELTLDPVDLLMEDRLKR